MTLLCLNLINKYNADIKSHKLHLPCCKWVWSFGQWLIN